MKQPRLWPIDSCEEWHSALERYPAVVQEQQVNGLAELDEWYRDGLPALVRARRPVHITRDELERVTLWKMKRGVWRERNRLLVLGNDPQLVKQTSIQAFAEVPDPRVPIDLISTLAGVGPATSSGVLAAHSPNVYPFFDELVANQIPRLGKVAFTAAYYQRYAAALRDRAAKLRQQCKHREWTAQDIGQALWSNSGGKAALKPKGKLKK